MPRQTHRNGCSLGRVKNTKIVQPPKRPNLESKPCPRPRHTAAACAAVSQGTVCFDSSLTLSTRDCPNPYLRSLARCAHEHGNNIVAVSKMSELEVAGRSIRWWLDDAGPEACYRHLTPLIHQDSA